MGQLRIATCLNIPEPDEDEGPLLAALAEAGIDGRMASWDDPGEDWDAAIPTVIRSTWNYIHDLPGFLGWVDRAARAAPLWNPPDIIRPNAHKSYLRHLAARGHSVVPTRFYTHGRPAVLPAVDRDIVIKPTVSGGSFRTRRFGPGERAAAQAFLDELTATRDAMVQPYVASVDAYGERALVWIDGEWTHAVRKTPRFSHEAEVVSEALPIADDERALAEGVLAPLASRLLYGRVDVARDDAGRPMVMELELIEPSLFVARHPPAMSRLVAALARRL